MDANNNLYALVHSCDNSNHQMDSHICEEWELEYDEVGDAFLRHIPVDAIGERVFVFEENPSTSYQLSNSALLGGNASKKVLLIAHRDTWASSFPNMKIETT